jgi:hypothetical protein
MPTSILELERQFDVELPRPRLTARRSQAMMNAAARWSAAIWTAAEAAGPIELGEAEIARGFDLARRPVFVCGVHRSGTTLVRDLLDNHPALAVLPSEGTFLTNFEPQLQRLPRERWLRFLGCEWLRRLANPINQQPYWLLGRTSEEHSPYIAFARSLMAWWPLMEERLGRFAPSWPLVAVAMAYAHCIDGLSVTSQLQRWVEKTPTNERFLDRLQLEFPAAKVVQVVRHPVAVYASRKQAQQRLGEPFRNAKRVLQDLRSSYRIAAEQSGSGASERYLLIRHEDLLARTPGTVDRLAAFLGIEQLPILMQPTVAGLPATSNSSFVFDAAPGRVHPETDGRGTDVLTRFDRERLTAVVGEAAISLGYDLIQVAPWRARLLRLAARLI